MARSTEQGHGAITSPREYDPTFLNARREALLIFAAWVVFFLWTVPFCCHFGYGPAAAGQPTLWGIPRWVFWGVGVPWVVADVFTLWLCLRYMKDDDLGEEGGAGSGERTA